MGEYKPCRQLKTSENVNGPARIFQGVLPACRKQRKKGPEGQPLEVWRMLRNMHTRTVREEVQEVISGR